MAHGASGMDADHRDLAFQTEDDVKQPAHHRSSSVCGKACGGALMCGVGAVCTRYDACVDR